MPSERSSSIDVAKGLAILGVILIHSELFSPGIFQAHGINRAVPIFFVLFGLTSTLWWEKTPPSGRIAAWYRSRLARLVPAYWAAVLAWWIGERVLSSHPIAVDALLWSLAGYAPWIQTSWFVTAILQLIVVFPLLRLATERLGLGLSVSLGAVVMLVAQFYALYINLWVKDFLPHPDQALGFYPFWIFVPPYLWLVLCGAAMTDFVRAARSAVLVAAITLVTAGALVEPLIAHSSLMVRLAASFVDPARTVLLLAVSGILARNDPFRRSLSWLGRNSWEIYVGQMSVHSLAYPAWQRAGGPLAHRPEYTLVLLIGGIGFAIAMSEARRRMRSTA